MTKSTTTNRQNTDWQFADVTRDVLRDQIAGRVLTHVDTEYDEARRVWNAMIDRFPAVIVQPQGPVDVMSAVRFARDHGLEIAIKGGGHSVAGLAAVDGGLMIDFSGMSSVRVKPGGRTVTVEPGALLRDVDRETQAHGLATPAGFISSTGLAGLTLGGGFGHLSRRFGLTVDNLRAVDIVTADASWVRATADTNPDLFWAVRGGGGNFGVVTAFEFDLHPVGPSVLAGPVVHAFDDVQAVMRGVAEHMRDAPDEVSCLPVIRHAPPAPFIPETYHGKMILLLAVICSSDRPDAEAALHSVRAVGDPIADAVQPRPYAAFQSMFDSTATAGARNYWKAHYLTELTGDVIDVLCEGAASMTSRESSIGMLSLGGAVSRRAAEATPYPHRDANWVVNIQARWREAAEDQRHMDWCREIFDVAAPHATGGAYVNFVSGDEDRLGAAYDDVTRGRLSTVKTRWDPDNVFHLNHNIVPAAT